MAYAPWVNDTSGTILGNGIANAGAITAQGLQQLGQGISQGVNAAVQGAMQGLEKAHQSAQLARANAGKMDTYKALADQGVIELDPSMLQDIAGIKNPQQQAAALAPIDEVFGAQMRQMIRQKDVPPPFNPSVVNAGNDGNGNPVYALTTSNSSAVPLRDQAPPAADGTATPVYDQAGNLIGNNIVAGNKTIFRAASSAKPDPVAEQTISGFVQQRSKFQDEISKGNQKPMGWLPDWFPGNTPYADQIAEINKKIKNAATVSADTQKALQGEDMGEQAAPEQSDAMMYARQAIAKGVPKDKVNERLKQLGLAPIP